MNERPVRFGAELSLTGILTEPGATEPRAGEPGTTEPRTAEPRTAEPRTGEPGATVSGSPCAVLLLNAGLIHRVGPNRLHVRLARRLADQGLHVLRFDFSGVGESTVSRETTAFEERAVNETRAAMDLLAQTCGVDRFILVGLCSGGDIAFRTAEADPRVHGAVLINGGLLEPVLTEEMLRAAHASIDRRYYRSRLLEPAAWFRFFGGQSRGRPLQLVARMVRSMLGGESQGRIVPMETAASGGGPTSTASGGSSLERPVPMEGGGTSPRPQLRVRTGASLVLVLSEGSVVWDLARGPFSSEINALVANRKLHMERIKRTDHTFTLRWSQDWLIDRIESWARQWMHE